MKNIFFSLILIAFLMLGCNSNKLADNPVSNQSNDIGNLSKGSSELHKELALARASTAKYHDIENAIEDGYVDINVVVQNMGYHLLNVSNWDAFDPGKPALLVYSKNSVNGKMRLVAVEYAVPSKDKHPKGSLVMMTCGNMMEILISGNAMPGFGIITPMGCLASITHVYMLMRPMLIIHKQQYTYCLSPQERGLFYFYS